MVLHTIKNLLPMKYILKSLPSGGIKNYIKMRKNNILEKLKEKVETEIYI